MKKLSRERLDGLASAAQARWRNEFRRKYKDYDLNKVTTSNKFLGQTLIRAPKTISIYDIDGDNCHYIKTLEFLDDIQSQYKAENCIIDFSETITITAAALVVVYAEIESVDSERLGRASIKWSVRSPRVNAILRSSNLHKLIAGHEINYALHSSRTMPIISSTGNNQMDEIIDFIQSRIYKDKMSPDKEYVYGDAVSETINNVGLHAYPRAIDSQKRWWLTCETFGKELYLAIYDRGVGIPKTVVERSWFLASIKSTMPEAYKQTLDEFPDLERTGWTAYVPTKIPDENLILLSMQGDVTGTKKDKHGQGSKSIMALVSDTSDGALWVFSNHGLYNFRQENKELKLAKLGKKFPGTLVQWNIELP